MNQQGQGNRNVTNSAAYEAAKMASQKLLIGGGSLGDLLAKTFDRAFGNKANPVGARPYVSLHPEPDAIYSTVAELHELLKSGHSQAQAHANKVHGKIDYLKERSINSINVRDQANAQMGVIASESNDPYELYYLLSNNTGNKDIARLVAANTAIDNKTQSILSGVDVYRTDYETQLNLARNHAATAETLDRILIGYPGTNDTIRMAAIKNAAARSQANAVTENPYALVCKSLAEGRLAHDEEGRAFIAAAVGGVRDGEWLDGIATEYAKAFPPSVSIVRAVVKNPATEIATLKNITNGFANLLLRPNDFELVMKRIENANQKTNSKAADQSLGCAV